MQTKLQVIYKIKEFRKITIDYRRLDATRSDMKAADMCRRYGLIVPNEELRHWWSIPDSWEKGEAKKKMYQSRGQVIKKKYFILDSKIRITDFTNFVLKANTFSAIDKCLSLVSVILKRFRNFTLLYLEIIAHNWVNS